MAAPLAVLSNTHHTCSAFESLPIPSQETEEWRYTDLEGFGFDLRPFVEGGHAENLDHVP